MKEKVKKKVYKKESRGITLVALVVTIVVLLILAGVTIATLFNDNGIIKSAQKAADNTKLGQFKDSVSLELLEAQMGENGTFNNKLDQGTIKGIIEKYGGTYNDNSAESKEDTITFEGATIDLSELYSGEVKRILAITSDEVKNVNHDTLEVKDAFENIVVVPKGFRVVEQNDTTKVQYPSTGGTPNVKDGVVIEDSDENQFVWIPVGIVYKSVTDKEDKSTIELARYTFDSSGTPNPVQKAYNEDGTPNYINPPDETKPTEYKNVIDGYFTELSNFREGSINKSDRSKDVNATAKNLGAFITSTTTNGGYYLARYEASYRSGYDASGTTDAERYRNAKPLSKKSTSYYTSSSSFSYTEGTLWNFINQINAARVSRNMYTEADNVGVESDLVNSYAWDTAIVYVQEMLDNNFANKKHSDVGSSGSLENTGSNENDKFCNIYNMVMNTSEWSTEYTPYTTSYYSYSFVNRGGGYQRRHWHS